jgi:hypothetical protein
MYWLRAEKLAEDFREGRVDEKERLKYYVATFVVWNLIPVFFVYGGPFQPIGPIYVALNLILTVLGIWECYITNKRGDSADFIVRMICLGWPAGVRIIFALFALCLIMIVAAISIPSLPPGPPVSESICGWLHNWGWYPGIPLFYFLQIQMGLDIVAGGKGWKKHIGLGKAQKSSDCTGKSKLP